MLLGAKATRQARYLNNYISNLLNPNLMSARTGKRVVDYVMSADDPHVSACMQSRKAGVFSMDYEIQADESSTVYMDFIKSIFDKLDIPQIINNILDAPFYGYQPFEILWQPEFYEGKLFTVVKDFIAKPYNWFAFDDYNQIRFKSPNKIRGEMLDKRKFICVQHQPTYDNPYGKSVLSKCLWSVAFKRGGITFWLKFIERFGMPHLIGQTNNTSEKHVNEFLELLDDLTQDGSTVINLQDTINALSVSSSLSTNVYKDLLEFCNTEISKAILSQTLTTEVTKGGNFATGKVHGSIMDHIVKSDKLLVTQTINKLIKLIIEINFGENLPTPKFIMYEETDVDKPMAEVVDLLSRNKTFQPTAKFYKKRFNFDEDEFKIVDPPPTTQQTGIPEALPGFSETEFKEGNYSPDQILIDAFADRGIKAGEDNFNQLAEIVKSHIEKQTDFKTALKQLSSVFSDMNTDELEQKLVNILFISDIIGRLSVQREIKNG